MADAEIERLNRLLCQYQATLDEADRRAGAAQRELVHLREQERVRDAWLRDAKVARGYSPNVSFDQVWEETCALADLTRNLRNSEAK